MVIRSNYASIQIQSKLKSIVQSASFNLTVFIQIPLQSYSVTKHVSQLHLNVYVQIEAGSTNRRKQVA